MANATFTRVSGKENNGNVGLLNGLTRDVRRLNSRTAIISLPVELLDIDEGYQTDARTERDLEYLTKNWDENRLLPLVGVPHWETGKVMIVDGFGRWIASQIIDKEKYAELEVMLLLNAPEDATERRKFEAEQYAFQNKTVAKMQPVQAHGALLIMEKEEAIILEEMKEEYDFEYMSKSGRRKAGVLGSYGTALKLCKVDNGACARYVFDICKDSAFDRKPNGYSNAMLQALGDMYRLFTNERDRAKEFLGEYLRERTPMILKADAVHKYPMLDARLALSLHIEDLFVENLSFDRVRELGEDNRVHLIAA